MDRLPRVRRWGRQSRKRRPNARARSSGPSAAQVSTLAPSPVTSRAMAAESVHPARLGEVAEEDGAVLLRGARPCSQPRISLWAISGTAPAKAAILAFSLIWFLSRTATAARMPEPYSTVTWPARRCAMAWRLVVAGGGRVGGVGAAGDQVGGVGRRTGLAEQHQQRREQQAERAARLVAALDRDDRHAVRLGQRRERAARPSATRVARRSPASTNQSSASAVSPEYDVTTTSVSGPTQPGSVEADGHLDRHREQSRPAARRPGARRRPSRRGRTARRCGTAPRRPARLAPAARRRAQLTRLAPSPVRAWFRRHRAPPGRRVRRSIDRSSAISTPAATIEPSEIARAGADAGTRGR